MTHPSIHETVGSLCLQLHAKSNEYAEVAIKRAKAEVAYKSGRAKRKLRARAEGDAKSIAEAETIADADDLIAELHLNYLIADGMTESLTKGMIALRERIGYGRSLMANEREADKLLATNREIT